MDHERRFDRDDRPDPPSEGVRIIGAEEAAEAIERGEVAPRRGDDELRYGDRPPPPATDGPRPALRFPLGSSADARDVPRGPAADPISEPVELPHWTQPPTGQVPQILPDQPHASRDEPEDWASFATSSPRWQDDPGRAEGSGYDASWGDADPLGALDDRDRPTHDDFFSFADLDRPVVPGRSVFADVDDDETSFAPAPAVGAWDDGEPGYEDQEAYEDPPSQRVATGQRVGRAIGGATHRAPRVPRGGGGGGGAAGGGTGGMDRDLGQAAVVGVGFLVLALIMFKLGAGPAMLLVVAVIGMAVAELYTVLRQAGYHPVNLVGIAGSVGLVISTYYYGYGALAPVLFVTTVACMLWYLVGAGTESPVMSIGVTLLGVLWIGMFGSYASMMLAGNNGPGRGVLLATILGTVGYDVGGLFVGQRAGRQPLSAASPNKTVEGLAGGMGVAFVVVVILSAAIGLGPISGLKDGAAVGLVVAIAAPLGDLCQSLVKRDLGVKDMGSVLPGHGGFLDRFDGLLFALPAVWFLATVYHF